MNVDAEKMESIGSFWSAGAKWNCTTEQVLGHDFSSDANGRVVPYGILDLQVNYGTLSVPPPTPRPLRATASRSGGAKSAVAATPYPRAHRPR